MSGLGLVLPAVSIGLGSLLVKPKRGFFPTGGIPIVAQVTLEEHHTDEMEITDHPVEQGAQVSDHAYKLPAEVTIICSWSNSPNQPGGLLGAAVAVASAVGGSTVSAITAAGSTLPAAQSVLSGNSVTQAKSIYQQLLKLQASAIPFDILTGKRSYKNMLFKSLSVVTDKDNENILSLTATCRQVLIASTRIITSSVNPSAQALPQETSPIVNSGPQSLTEGLSFTPDSSVFSGAITDLQNGCTSAQTMFEQLPGGLDRLSGAVSGAVGNIPEVLTQTQAALDQVVANLPTPLEIPAIANPQIFTASFGAPINAALTSAIEQLPSVLETTQSVVNKALTEIPGVVSQLPSALSQITPALTTIQTQIKTVADQVPSVLKRLESATKG